MRNNNKNSYNKNYEGAFNYTYNPTSPRKKEGQETSTKNGDSPLQSNRTRASNKWKQFSVGKLGSK